MTQSKEHTPLPWRNYKHWIFDANDDHVFNPDHDHLSEDEVKIIVDVVNKQNESLLQENARLREALEKIVAMKPEVYNGETIYSIYPGAPSWPQRVAKEALESPRGESPSTKGSGEEK